LDAAFAVLRHITGPFVDGMMKEVLEAIGQTEGERAEQRAEVKEKDKETAE
jgi:hypothetical protein